MRVDFYKKSSLRNLTFLLLAVFNIAFAQDKTGGIDFFHGTFQEALDKAASENKLIFMDAFTTWCGPCRKMSASIFPDPTVGEFYNANFVNIKVDMEKDEGPSLGNKYSVRSYPTLLFIDGTGKVIHSTAGARPVDAFIELGREALKKMDRAVDYEKQYNEGKRDYQTILAYIKMLNRQGKSSLKVANDYLATQTDISTKENVELIIEAATEADSKIFDYLIQNKTAIIRDKTQTVFDTKVQNCCTKTFKKALEYRNAGLLKEAQSKMKHVPAKQALFIANTNMQYYGETGDAKQFTKAAKSYASKFAKSDASKLQEVSMQCLKYFKSDVNVMKLAEKWAKKAMTNGGNPAQYLNYAIILKEQGKKTEALDILKKAAQLPMDKPEVHNTINFLIKELESK
ncbi:MAG TPA: thioredoxin family protein [Saprospiraceae bacterium]|nr:thioredoxin family protein [Saprospiraceae bacterium]